MKCSKEMGCVIVNLHQPNSDHRAGIIIYTAASYCAKASLFAQASTYVSDSGERVCE